MSDARVCSYCGRATEWLRQQSRQNRGKLICIPCDRDRERAYRQGAGPQANLRAAAARRYQKGKALLAELKSGPCVDCGKTYIPRAMHFDHRDPATKKSNISLLAASNRVEAMLEEVAKCDLVCCLCHAYRTERQVQAGLIKRGRPQNTTAIAVV